MQCIRRAVWWLKQQQQQLSRTLTVSSSFDDHLHLQQQQRVLVEGTNRYSRLALLNRPSALNAINTEMAARLQQLYKSWEDNPDIGFVIITLVSVLGFNYERSSVTFSPSSQSQLSKIFTVLDFCCGANDFSCLMKSKLDQTGKFSCSFKNYDLFQAKNDCNFEKRDWMTVQAKELPNGSQLIIGLNPPFGVNGSLANKFIDKALSFKPKLLILIVPKVTKRLDRKKGGYDLIWEDDEICSGKDIIRLPRLFRFLQ